jgi:1-acyl-sn-glycerol-3-phosphate acyltransferase
VLYSFLKWYISGAIHLFCLKIKVNRPELLSSKGPILFASNHPNSFLDGIILTTLFDEPLYSLARGDAFKTPGMNRFLRSIRLLPVYRTSEGMENLGHNYTTFDSCLEAFGNGGSVLIFSEGRCENEWHLRPLKKGTARLAMAAWEKGLPLTIIPTAFNYSSFKNFGKEVHLFFGDPIDASVCRSVEGNGKQLLAFNDVLYSSLSSIVYEIPEDNRQMIRRKFNIRTRFSTFALMLPALAGVLLHAPLFFPVTWFTRSRFHDSGHFDSVQTALLLLFYPFYLTLLVVIGWSFFSWYALFLLVVAPLTARAAVEVKYSFGL